MMPNRYHIEENILKTTGPINLWQGERGLVQVEKDTLALPVMLGERVRGYIFHGEGDLILDAIVETEAGALGRPVTKKLDKPFLVLRDDDKLSSNLESAGEDDLKNRSYLNKDQFLQAAKSLLDRFPRKRMIGDYSSSGYGGSIFLFQNESGKPDLLLLNGSRLVYKSSGTMFALSGRRVVLKGHDGFAVSVDGRCFVVNR